jgi:hypothetical protein
MFAIVVKVELPEGGTIEEGRKQLETEVIPIIKQSPGFIAAYFLSPPTGRDGLSFTLYKDEESARAAAKMVNPPAPVKLVDVEVREVAASATA